MKYIDKIRKATQEVIDEIKWPMQERAIRRSFESVIDKADALTGTVEGKILDIEKALTRASEEEMKRLIEQGLNLLADLDAAKQNASAARAWLAKLEAKAE